MCRPSGDISPAHSRDGVFAEDRGFAVRQGEVPQIRHGTAGRGPSDPLWSFAIRDFPSADQDRASPWKPEIGSSSSLPTPFERLR